MKAILANDSSKMYTKILLSIILCIVITLLIASTILHINFERIALEQVYKSNLNSLTQTSNEVSNMTEIAEELTFQIYSDSTLASLLHYSDPDIYEETLAMIQLNYYRLALPFIDSIYIYNAQIEEFFISSNQMQNGRQNKSDLDDKEILDILNQFQDYKPYTPIPRTYEVGTFTPLEVNSYTYLGYNTLNQFLDYAVIVNITDTWINQDIGGVDEDSSEQTFIINESGILYSRNSDSPMLSDYSHKDYMKEILQNPDSSDYFEDDVDGINSIITYTAPDSLGWRYVRITPYNEITAEIRDVRMKTVYFSLAILLLGLLISVFASRKLYGPIQKAMHRMKILENERRNNLEILRQEILRNVILGRETYNTRTLQEKLTSVGSKINIDGQFTLILFKIDKFNIFVEKYGEDAKLIKYAIMNICSEIASPDFKTETIDMGEDSIILLLNCIENVMDQESFLIMLQEMQANVSKHLKLSVSLTVSPAEESVFQISDMYKQVVKAAFHRLFYGHGCILFSNIISDMKSKEYEFPINKEKQLIDYMMTGKADDAKKIYSDIIIETSEYPYTVVQLAISHLTLTISNVLNTIKRNNSLVIDSDFDATILSINHAETIEEINEQFYELFDDISKRLDEKRSSKHDDLVKKINEMIIEEYSDYNLGLNSIADELNMSPVYISRLYKQLTLQTPTDAISEMRMNKAKELLLKTDYSIADIAEKTGFTNSSYFYRMFKKSNGVTPNDFRKTK